MTQAEQIALLQQQLKLVLEAYAILEEYTFELVGEDNKILTLANGIIDKATKKSIQ